MACLSALASSGVKARRACWTRLPSWASTPAGTSLGDCVTKKTPMPFERMSRTVCSMACRNALLASLKSRCASSKKKTSFGLSRSPSSGRSWKRSASIHMRNVEKSCGRSWTWGSSRQEIIPLPSAAVRSRSLVSNSGSPKKSPAPWSSKVMRLRRMTPGRRAREAAEVLEVGLALVGGQVGDDGAQVLEVEQGEAVLVGVVEDQPEAALLRVVEAEDLAEQGRAEARDRGADRDAVALAAERVELGGVCRRRPRHADVGRAAGDLVAALAGRREAGQVALHVGEEDRDALVGQLLGHELERLRLAGAGRAGDEAVAVEHAQRDLHRGVGVGLPVDHGGTQLEHGAVERVAGADLVDLGGVARAPV